ASALNPEPRTTANDGSSVKAARTAAAAWAALEWRSPGGAGGCSCRLTRGSPRAPREGSWPKAPPKRPPAPTPPAPGAPPGRRRRVVGALGQEGTMAAELDADRADVGEPEKSKAGYHD